MSISIVDSHGTISSCAPTDDWVDELDQLQTELAEGPCLEAIATESTVRVHDLSAQTDRWPSFTPYALERGTASILSVRLSAAHWLVDETTSQQ